MASDAGEFGQLVVDARRTLVPPPFPPRRDLDVSMRATDCDPDVTLFYDIFWPRQDRLACFVVRIDGGGVGSLMAHALKALLRAGLCSHTPDHALTLSLRALDLIGRARVDAAAATLSTTTGEADFAHRGVGTAGPIAQGRGVFWLSVGPVAPIPPQDDLCDASDFVEAALADTHSTAAVAIALSGQRSEGGRTFTLTNDVAGISPILAEIDQHLRNSGVGYAASAGLDVAMDEVLTNIVLYAYRDGRSHDILIHVHVQDVRSQEVRSEDARLRVEIRDDGIPFDPTTASAPDIEAELADRPIGGLGLHFVRTVFETVAYQRTGGWNVLTLTKPLPAAQPEEPHA